MKVVITLESKDPLAPSKSSAPMDPEDAVITMREAIFRVAMGEYSAVYATRANPLGLKSVPTSPLINQQ